MTTRSTSAAYVSVYGWSAPLKGASLGTWPSSTSPPGPAQAVPKVEAQRSGVRLPLLLEPRKETPWQNRRWPETRGRPAPAARRRAGRCETSAGSDLHVKSSVRIAEHEVQVPATWGRQIYSGRIVAGRGNGTWIALHNHCASSSHWARRYDEDPGRLKTADPQNLVLPYGASTRNKMRALPEEVGDETHCLWLGDGPIEAVQPGDPRCRRSRGSEERRRTAAAREGQRRGDG